MARPHRRKWITEAEIDSPVRVRRRKPQAAPHIAPRLLIACVRAAPRHSPETRQTRPGQNRQPGNHRMPIIGRGGPPQLPPARKRDPHAPEDRHQITRPRASAMQTT